MRLKSPTSALSLKSIQVGKSSLVSQCITSDYINTYDASLGRLPTPPLLFLDYPSPTADDEYGEKSVSVSLDGQEAEITFIDHPSNEMSVSSHHEYVRVCNFAVIGSTARTASVTFINHPLHTYVMLIRRHKKYCTNTGQVCL